MKTKGGMWCVNEQRPVAAQKSTHRFRNTLATVTLPATALWSAAAMTSGQWHCPHCGGPVERAARRSAPSSPMTFQSAPPSRASRRAIKQAAKQRQDNDPLVERERNIARLERERQFDRDKPVPEWTLEQCSAYVTGADDDYTSSDPIYVEARKRMDRESA